MFAIRIKQVLSPLGDGIDDEVFEYLADLMKDSPGTEATLDEICATYIPGYLDLGKQEKSRILNKLQNIFKNNPSSSSHSASSSSSTKAKPPPRTTSSSSSTVTVPLNFSNPAPDDIWNVPTTTTASVLSSAVSSSLDSHDILATLPSSFQNIQISRTVNHTTEASIDTRDDNDDEEENDDHDNDIFTSEIGIVMSKVSREHIAALQALFPHLSESLCRFVLARVTTTTMSVATDTVGTAAEYVLEHPNIDQELRDVQLNEQKTYEERKKRKKEELEKERQAKTMILNRFDEREDDSGKIFRPTIPKEMQKTYRKGEKVLKYLDGKIIHMKPGEKYYIEEPAQEYGQVHSLKIKKKGQGGKSPGFK